MESRRHVVSQMLRLVDDQHRQLLGLLRQPGDLDTDGAVGGGAGALGGQPHLPGDGLVHVEHVAGGQRDIVAAVLPRMQSSLDPMQRKTILERWFPNDRAATNLEPGKVGVRHSIRRAVYDGERVNNHLVARLPDWLRPSRSFRCADSFLTGPASPAVVHYDGCHRSRAEALIPERRLTHRISDTHRPFCSFD